MLSIKKTIRTFPVSCQSQLISTIERIEAILMNELALSTSKDCRVETILESTRDAFIHTEMVLEILRLSSIQETDVHSVDIIATNNPPIGMSDYNYHIGMGRASIARAEAASDEYNPFLIKLCILISFSIGILYFWALSTIWPVLLTEPLAALSAAIWPVFVGIVLGVFALARQGDLWELIDRLNVELPQAIFLKEEELRQQPEAQI